MNEIRFGAQDGGLTGAILFAAQNAFVGSVAYSIQADPGALAIAGGDVELVALDATTLDADPGTLHFFGQESSVELALETEPGMLEISGGDAGLTWSTSIIAEPADLALTAAGAAFATSMTAEPGGLAIDGANIIFGGDEILTAEGGALALTAAAVPFDASIAAAAGVLGLVGGDATLAATGNVGFSADAGVLALIGADVDFVERETATLAAEAGALVLDGADMVVRYTLEAAAGELVIEGAEVVLRSSGLPASTPLPGRTFVVKPPSGSRDMSCEIIQAVCKRAGERVPFPAFDLTWRFTRLWLPNHYFAPGVCVRPSGETRRTGLEYESSGGVSGPREPKRWPTMPGASIVEGSITWTAREISNDSLIYRIASITYAAPDGVELHEQDFIDEPGAQLVPFEVSGGQPGGTYDVVARVQGTTVGGSSPLLECVLRVTIER